MIRTKNIRLTLIALLCIAAGCRNNYVIPENDMVQVLTKVYINEGILLNLETSNQEKENMLFYEPIVEAFGYTREQFDSSIRYYSYHADVFDRIYDEVISELTKLEAHIADEAKREAEANSLLWPMANNLTLQQADSMGNPHLQFEVPITRIGLYTLSFDFQRFADDNADAPKIEVALYNADGTAFEEKTYTYVVEDEPRLHSFSLEATDSSINTLRGHLYMHPTTDSTPTLRHAQFANITLRYEPLSSKRPQRIRKPADKQKLQLNKDNRNKAKLQKTARLEEAAQ